MCCISIKEIDTSLATTPPKTIVLKGAVVILEEHTIVL